MFIAALFRIAQEWKQPERSSVGEWVNMMYVFIRWNITQQLIDY